VVDTPLDELNEQLEEANAARLLVESRGRLGVYSFSHALVRETLYASLTATRRARFHELIAEAIENMPEGEDGEMLPDLAHHYFEAASGTQVLEKAIGYAAEAGARASEQLAYEQAATQYRRALNGLRLKDTDKERQCELLLELGENLWNSGEYGQARDSFREAAGLAEQLARPHLLARAALGVGGRLGLPLEGGITDSVLISTLRRSLELLGSDDPPLRARLMGRLGSAVLFSEERDHGEKLAREAIILARMTGDDALLARILSDTWLACTRRGNLDERLARGRENVEVADRTGVATLRLESRLWLAAAMYEEGEIEATAPILETCRMLVEELHQPYYTWFYTLFESAQGIMVGDLDAAEARMWEALDSGQKSDNPCAAELFAPQSLMLRLLQGRIAETHAGSKAMTSHFASIFAFRSGLATIYAEMGLVPEAKREFERLAVNGFRDISDDVFWLSTVHLLADVCAFLEDSERAAELYELLLPCSGRYVMLGAMCAAAGSVDRGLGVLCTVMGRLDEADAFLAKAAELEERVGSIPALAMTRCDQARVHVLRGTPEDIVAAQRLLAAARAVTASHDLGGIDHRIDAVQILITGDDPHVHAQRRRRRRDDVKAAISTRGRASLGRIVGDASDEDIERRFGSKLALRGLFSGMAQGFQPRMALGFEGEISFEVWQQTASGTARTSDWWTIQITSTKATARHRTAKAPAATIHAPLPDLIRVVAGLSNPVTMWVEKRIEVDGDILLSTRLVELFGGEEPLEIG
jgi:tetratricopeptide (TPR) repeat protein